MHKGRLVLLMKTLLVLQFHLLLGLVQLVTLGDYLGLVQIPHSYTLVHFLLLAMEVLESLPL